MGAPDSVPAGNVARNASKQSRPSASRAAHVRDDVHDVRIALDHEALGHLDAADRGDPADVVPAEVEQHDVLGDLLRVGEQRSLELAILHLLRAARRRPGDRPDRHLAVLDPRHHLGRRADQRLLAELQVEHVRRWVDRAERAIDVEGRGPERRLEALREHDLDDVAGSDVLLGALDHGAELRAREIGARRQALAGRRQGVRERERRARDARPARRCATTARS